ncbi:MAG: hypothetical protein ABFD60_17135 [Bryobacteraceae bacterium]
MLRRRPRLAHPPGIWERLRDRFQGRDQFLTSGPGDLPLLLINYPRGMSDAAREIELAYTHTFEALRPETREPYAEIVRALPALVVVLVRRKNPCGCLGHHHPQGTESRLSRRLASELGHPVGEIDIAYEEIREWRPQPISSMALGELGGPVEAMHTRAATLAVLLHELEHLARPDGRESEIRRRSNAFYTAVMEELAAGEMGADYGMTSPPPPRA